MRARWIEPQLLLLLLPRMVMADHVAFIRAYLTAELGIQADLSALSVQYGPFLGEVAAHPGRIVSGADSAYSRFTSFLREAPRVTWRAKEDDLHTLLMIDADARPKGPYMHWMLVNCKNGTTEDSSVMYKYQGPGQTKTAPKGTHRYIFLLLKQALACARAARTRALRLLIVVPCGTGVSKGHRQRGAAGSVGHRTLFRSKRRAYLSGRKDERPETSLCGLLLCGRRWAKKQQPPAHEG